LASRADGYQWAVHADPATPSAQLLQAAINGSRSDDEHPAIPRTPAELAEAAWASAIAGAGVVHLHVYDAEGRETFDSVETQLALLEIRATCPRTPLSLSTSAEIDPDPERRRAEIEHWRELPDLVTANQGEPGIVELCDDLIARGVGIEAGLLEVVDAEAFVESGLAGRCVRAMVEPLDELVDDALAKAAAIEAVLAEAAIGLEQVHHGDGLACWAVNRRAAERGHGIRTGLEDTLVMPDDTPAGDNAELVRAAAKLLR
jgi:uncharacterized protein (DUF849 family)